METPDEPTPKVRPLDEETPPPAPGRRTVVGVVMVIAIGGAIFLATGPTQLPPQGIALPSLPATSSTTPTSLPLAGNPDVPSLVVPGDDFVLSARMAQLLDDANAIWDALPQADGEFVAVVGAPIGTDLVQVTRDSAQLQLDRKTLNWRSIAFDQSGQYLAYTADSPISDGPALYVESATSVPVMDWVGSFAWHATIPGRIAWQQLATEDLCWADVGGPEEPKSPLCVPGPAFGTRLVEFDNEGFIGIDGVGQAVSRYGFDGQRVGSVSGEYAWPLPSGDLLVAERDLVNDRTIFTYVDGQFANPITLDWAPTIRTDEPVLVAVSPSMAYPEIAFITWQNREPQLQVFDNDGTLTRTVALGGWVTDIRWDSTGRYLLMPGAFETEQVLYVYDYSTSSLVTLSFGGWVQKAVLVTPVLCEDANHVAVTLASRLPPEVTLQSAQLLKSRDANLLAFSFLSALVSGGPGNGEVATWALPGYSPTADDDAPDRMVAINEPAQWLNIDTMDDVFEIDDWMRVDGAIGSQLCITGPPDGPTLP
ncbi:MAG: hypothetical protein JJE47_12895 [Acidimicrobiia bacterium]|nr:hypothetical protein [Acidimicrobiia bacterium]